MNFWIWIEMKKTGWTIQNPILNMDCQSQSNPPNRISVRIEGSSNILRRGSTEL